jgi:Cof subfamily protein (haloacid dehalogenase superfamily)
MPPIRLLALDVDGTLLRSDGTVADADRRAIAAALERGIAVTLATGRLSSSALPFARSLALEVPLVCADGAVLFCPNRAVPLVETPLASTGLSTFLGLARTHQLAPFLFSHEAVCGAAGDLDRYPWVSGWTDRFVDHGQAGFPDGGPALITAIGVGRAEPVAAVHEALKADPAVADEVMVFPIRTTDAWVVRLSPGGCSKAVGLAVLAERLGITAAEVVAVGDWYNDVPMLAWAGRSFAMGQAPDQVKDAATHLLRSTAATGGAVAEALSMLQIL